MSKNSRLKVLHRLLNCENASESERKKGCKRKYADIRNIASKACAFSKSEDVHMLWSDLSDDIWLHILPFCYGNKLGGIGMDDMFRQLPPVSKRFQQLCIHYVQKIPQYFLAFGEQMDDLRVVAFASRYRAKIGSFRRCELVNPSYWISAIIHMFKMCDLQELHSLDILSVECVQQQSLFLSSHSYNPLEVGFQCQGIPYSCLRKDIRDHHYLHNALANVFSRKHPPLRKLSITVSMLLWPHPLLEMVSDTIEELHLQIPPPDDDADDGDGDGDGDADPFEHEDKMIEFIEYLNNTLGNMKMLRKIKLNISTVVPILGIRSQTLEEIDLLECPMYVRMASCQCPSLKLLSCFSFRSSPGNKFVVHPLNSSVQTQLDALGSGGSLEITHREASFDGMHIPGSCIVKFNSPLP